MKKIYIILAIFCLFTSCENFLDLPPADQISSSQYWNKATDLENYMLQFYPSLPNFNNISGYYGPYGIDGIKGSDHQIQNVTVSTQLNGTRSVVQSGGGWSWNNIRALNIFLENYKKVDAPFANIQQFLGEAYFFKAFFYFNLESAYGDVPWFTHSMQMNSEDLYKARDKRTIVVDSILWCLDKAIENLNFRNKVDGGGNRLNKEAALIFKSRVALFEGTWQKYHSGTAFGTPGANPGKYLQSAVDAVVELMTPGKYTIGIYNTGSAANDYSKLFNSNDLSSNKEVPLWAKCDLSLQLTHAFQSNMNYGYTPFVTNQLVENYLKRDGTPYNVIVVGQSTKGKAFLTKITSECDYRLSSIIDAPGMLMWSSGSTGYYVRPLLYESGDRYNSTGYQMRKGLDPASLDGSLAYQNKFITAYPVFRYAEALLNYAEAQAELGQTVDYSKSLNLLRARAGMPNFAAIADPLRSDYANFGYPLTDELYEIRRERAVELACEGLRNNDWRRWRAHALFKGKQPKGFPFLASDYPDYSTLANKLSLDTDGFILPFKKLIPNGYNFNENRDYLDCIPTNEITLNPALTQNPGW